MKSWYRTSKDIDTKDGTMVRVWTTVFETDDYSLSEASVEWCREKLNDAVPVKHGRWIKGSETKMIKKNRYLILADAMYCSECENEAYWDTDYGQQLFDYCPNCGARMDEE